MMKALYAGGIPAIYRPDLDVEANPESDENYQANPGGLFEVGPGYYLNAKFLREGIADESVIKIMFDGLPALPAGAYKIVFMLRDPEEIQASLERMDSHLSKHDIKPTADWPAPFNCFRPYKQEDIDHVIGICDLRADISLIRINFKDVIEHPGHELETLRLFGFPIDVKKAVAAIDSKLWRTRNEHGENRCI